MDVAFPLSDLSRSGQTFPQILDTIHTLSWSLLQMNKMSTSRCKQNRQKEDAWRTYQQLQEYALPLAPINSFLMLQSSSFHVLTQMIMGRRCVVLVKVHIIIMVGFFAVVDLFLSEIHLALWIKTWAILTPVQTVPVWIIGLLMRVVSWMQSARMKKNSPHQGTLLRSLSIPPRDVS